MGELIETVKIFYFANNLRWLRQQGMPPKDLAKLCDDAWIANDRISWSTDEFYEPVASAL